MDSLRLHGGDPGLVSGHGPQHQDREGLRHRAGDLYDRGVPEDRVRLCRGHFHESYGRARQSHHRQDRGWPVQRGRGLRPGRQGRRRRHYALLRFWSCDRDRRDRSRSRRRDHLEHHHHRRLVLRQGRRPGRRGCLIKTARRKQTWQNLH